MRLFYSPLSISAPFYRYLKLLKLHWKERSAILVSRAVKLSMPSFPFVQLKQMYHVFHSRFAMEIYSF